MYKGNEPWPSANRKKKKKKRIRMQFEVLQTRQRLQSVLRDVGQAIRRQIQVDSFLRQFPESLRKKVECE